MATEYEGLDISEMQNEYERVSAEPGSFGGEDFLEKLCVSLSVTAIH